MPAINAMTGASEAGVNADLDCTTADLDNLIDSTQWWMADWVEAEASVCVYPTTASVKGLMTM